jgi:hypothetical protein
MTSLNDILNKKLEITRLRELLPARSKVVLYDTLARDKRGRGEVLKNLDSLIVLYEGTINKKRAGHYVVLLPRAHHIEYFSSLARSPSDEMSAFHEDPGVFKRLLGKNFTYNRKKLQMNSYTLQDCGYWVLARAILHKLKIAQFQRLFKPLSLRSSDECLGMMSILVANL